MNTMIKASVIFLVTIGLGLLLVPVAKSGSTCGGCNSKSATISSRKPIVGEPNQDIIMLEELSGRLAQNIADLEQQFSVLVDVVKEDRSRKELAKAKLALDELRSDIANYQVLSLRALAARGHQEVDIDEDRLTTDVGQDGCSH